MKLLTFAHYHEALPTIENLGLQSSSRRGKTPLFCNDDFQLVVTGEGIEKAMLATSWILTLEPEITEVINLGVAGSLTPSLEVGTTLGIRTVYGENKFHSFSSPHTDSKIDLVSSLKRAQHPEQISLLLPYATLVDREAWGVAYSCSYFQRPFRCGKIISDIVGVNTDCKAIQLKALEYGEKLYQYLTNILKEDPKRPSSSGISLPQGFYFTHSQKAQFIKLLRALSISLDTPEDLLLGNIPEVDSILQMDIRPKNKTELLIKCLEHLLNPQQRNLMIQVQDLLAPLHKAKWSVQSPLQNPQGNLKISTEVKDEKDLAVKINSLQQLSLKKLLQLSHGMNSDEV